VLTTAFVAFVQMAAQGCRAASQDVLEGPSMAGRHSIAELFEIGRAVLPQDIGHFDHGGSAGHQPRVITLLTWAWTSAIVLWVRCR
jgi:hypothetical protein